jgi:S4 domain-containing protein
VEFAKVYAGLSQVLEDEQGDEELSKAQNEEANRRVRRGETQFGGAVGIYSIVKLIRELGLASATEAAKLIKAGAVSINGVKQASLYYTQTGEAGPTESSPLRLTVRLGKRAKVAVIS